MGRMTVTIKVEGVEEGHGYEVVVYGAVNGAEEKELKRVRPAQASVEEAYTHAEKVACTLLALIRKELPGIAVVTEIKDEGEEA